MDLFRWKFVSDGGRQVTVQAAATEQEARIEAHGVLDQRAYKEGREPPVGWGLHLVSSEPIRAKRKDST